MSTLSLDALTLPHASPDEAIRSAFLSGFDLVSLAVQAPYVYPEPLVTAANYEACAAALSETGVQVHSLEFFVLGETELLESYRPALELGARLGGKAAVALNLLTSDVDVAGKQLAQFASIAADYGLGVNLEPVAGSQTQTLAEGQALIKLSGRDVGMIFDALHFVRSGSVIKDLDAIDQQLIRYIQLCDGPLVIAQEDLAHEAIGERLYPGDGEFPLLEILRHCPRDVPIAIEAPSLCRVEKGMTYEDQVHEAMAAMRKLLGRKA